MSLGQAAGGRPRGVARPPARPTAPGLGLGLGLGAKQRGGFQQATQQGNAGGWLAAHPGVQQRIQQESPTGWRATNLQNFIGTGQRQPYMGGARGAPGSDNMPQPPPAQQRPPMMIGQPPPPATMGQVGGNMYGQQGVGGGGYQLPNMGVNPGMQSVLQNRANGFNAPPPQYMAQMRAQEAQYPGSTMLAGAGGGGPFQGTQWSGFQPTRQNMLPPGFMDQARADFQRGQQTYGPDYGRAIPQGPSSLGMGGGRYGGGYPFAQSNYQSGNSMLGPNWQPGQPA